MEKKSWLSLFPKLLLAMLLVALLPVAGLWYINYENTRLELQASVEQDLDQTLNAVATKVNDWIDLNLGVLSQNARLPAIESMDPQQQKPVLEAIEQTYDWLYLSHVTAADGNNTARSDDKPPKYYGDREYFEQIFKRGRDYGQQVLIGKTSGKPALVLTAPVQDGEGNRQALLAIAASLVSISKAVADAKIGETGFAFLVDNKGRVVAHGRPEQVSENLQDFSKHPAVRKGFYRDKLTFDENGNKIIARTARLGLDWHLIVQQDYTEAFAPLQTARQNALTILGVTLVGVLLVAFIVAQLMAAPIRKLTAVANAYSRGELDAHIPGCERGDEIGALARAIDRMGISLKMAFSELTRGKAA